MLPKERECKRAYYPLRAVVSAVSLGTKAVNLEASNQGWKWHPGDFLSPRKNQVNQCKQHNLEMKSSNIKAFFTGAQGCDDRGNNPPR